MSGSRSHTFTQPPYHEFCVNTRDKSGVHTGIATTNDFPVSKHGGTPGQLSQLGNLELLAVSRQQMSDWGWIDDQHEDDGTPLSEDLESFADELSALAFFGSGSSSSDCGGDGGIIRSRSSRVSGSIGGTVGSAAGVS